MQRHHDRLPVAARLRPLALAAALALSTASAGAVDLVWVGPADNGFWDTASNWSPLAPSLGDNIALGIANTTFRSGALALTSFVGNGLLSISGGSLSTLVGSSIGGLALSGGTLGGTGLVIVTGEAASSWSAGAMTGLGGTTFLGNVSFVGGEGRNKVVDARSLVFAGTSTWLADPWGTGFYLSSGATITNNGTWVDQTIGGLPAIHANGGAPSKFINSGTYHKTGSGTSTIQVQFDNTRGGIGSGRLIVDSGTLVLSGGGTSDGTFDVAAGAAVRFAGGTHTLFGIDSGNRSGTLETGAGTVIANDANRFAGTLAVSGGTLSVNGSIDAGGFAMRGGVLDGAGTVTIAGALPSTWGAGTLAGSGTTVFNGPITFVGGENQNHGIDGRSVAFNGTSTWAADAWGTGFYLGNGATVTNNGRWQDQTIGGLPAFHATGGAASSFVNNGVYAKTGSGTTTFGVPFRNVRNGPGQGEIEVSAGTLAFAAGGSSNGRYDVASGATVAFTAGSTVLDGITSGTGTGTLLTGGANVQAGGANVFAGRLGFTSGQMTVDGSFTAGGLAMSGGRLTGAGAVTFDGTLASTWGAGTLAGSGSTTINGPITFVGGENQNHVISGRSVTFNGTSTWAADPWGTRFYLDSGARIVNNGSWLDQTVGSLPAIVANGGATPTFENNGSYVKSGAGSVTDLSTIHVVNTGLIDVQRGTLRLPADFVNGGTLKGNGTVATSSFVNEGIVAPGASPGTLTLTGSFVQAATGSLAIELESTAVHDLFVIGNGATLGGTLDILCYAGCPVTAGDSFRIVDAAPGRLDGSFAHVAALGFSGVGFDVVYDRVNGDVLLNAVPVPEPSTTALALAGGGVLLFVARRRRAAAAGGPA